MTREEAILLLHDMKDTYDEIHENTNYEIGYEQMTALDMAIEALSAKPQIDLISRADVLKYPIRLDHYDEVNGNRHFVLGIESVMEYVEALPSADAEQTVIRSRTLLPTKDFKEWAKRIKEVNHNAVVIPCDAEIVSADAVQGEWQKVEEQPYFRKHYDTVCCSVCRKKGNRKWNYCPNCGARMKGGAE